MPHNAYIDLITNHPFLAELDVDVLLDVLSNNKADIPPDIVTEFVHEATHHWCFSSLVGDAIAAVKLFNLGRIYDQSTSVITSQKNIPPDKVEDSIISQLTQVVENHSEPIDQFCKAHYAEKLLNPITEGLALYAELDAYVSPPTEVDQLSPILWLSRVMGGAEDELLEILTSDNFDTLRKQRRERLYCETINTEHGGHLIGYCFVRKLEKLLSQCGILIDSMCFLNAIKVLFFDDPILTKLVLNGNVDRSQFIQAFNHRFVEICQSLVDKDISENIARPHFSADDEITWPVFTSKAMSTKTHAMITGLDEHVIKEAHMDMSNHYHVLGVNRESEAKVANFEGKSTGALMLMSIQRSLLSRRYCTFGGIEVEMSSSVSDGVLELEINHSGSPLIKCLIKVNDNDVEIYSDLDKTVCRLDLYFHESSSQIHWALSRGYDCIGSVVVTEDGPRWNFSDESNIFGRKPSLFTKELLETGIHILDGSSSLKIFEREMRDQIQKLYLEKVLPTSDFWSDVGVNVELTEKRINMMSRNGLAGLFYPDMDGYQEWINSDHEYRIARAKEEYKRSPKSSDIAQVSLGFNGWLVILITGLLAYYLLFR